MSTQDALYIVAAFIVGVACGSVATLANEAFGDAVGAFFGFFIVRLVPFTMWAYQARQGQGYQVRLPGKAQGATWISDGNVWGGVFLSEDKHSGLSPLLLLPAGLVRLAVRLWGRELLVEYKGEEEHHGSIVLALRVAPGLILARRRDEDLSYLKEHGRFPTFDLLTRRPLPLPA
jgi:hypothetical protein